MKHRQGGFTLFETLVAMTLMALLLGALLPVFRGGLQSLRVGAGQTRATLLAEALLKRALVEQTGPALVEPTVGRRGELRWRIQRQPYVESQLPVAAVAEPAGAPLWEISARVEWQPGRSVVLRGLAPANRTVAAGRAGSSGS